MITCILEGVCLCLCHTSTYVACQSLCHRSEAANSQDAHHVVPVQEAAKALAASPPPDPDEHTRLDLRHHQVLLRASADENNSAPALQWCTGASMPLLPVLPLNTGPARSCRLSMTTQHCPASGLVAEQAVSSLHPISC